MEFNDFIATPKDDLQHLKSIDLKVWILPASDSNLDKAAGIVIKKIRLRELKIAGLSDFAFSPIPRVSFHF